jgi:ribosomal protein S18 acetylase RimI-like enzyme
LDVAASNARAVRCYEKVGFVRTSAIWHEAGDLYDVDTDEPRYDFIRPHIRNQDGKVELEFLVMELAGEDCQGGSERG